MTFETFQKTFFLVVAAFIVFVVLKIFLTKLRWREDQERRMQRIREAQDGSGSGSTTSSNGALHSTFGFSGQSASDSTPAGSLGTGVLGGTSDCGPGESGADCGDTGGGDSGGGGWND